MVTTIAFSTLALQAQNLVQLTDSTQLNGLSVTGQPGQLGGRDCDIGDIDGDGDQDFVVGGASFLIYVNAHAAPGAVFDSNEAYGAFRMESATRVTGASFPWQGAADAVHLADLDGDSDLDVVVGFRSRTQVIYLNNGLGVFTTIPTNLTPVNETTTSIDSADIDGDGDLDLVFGTVSHVAGGAWVGGQSQLFRNDGIIGGLLTFTNITATNLPAMVLFTEDLAFGDLDGDGDLDLVLGNRTFSSGPFAVPGQNLVYLNNGVGAFTNDASRIYSIGLGNEFTYGIELADFEGDGDLDLVAANAPGSLVALNTGGAGWALAPATVLASNGGFNHDVAVGDVDLDGDPDLVFASNRQGVGMPAQDNEEVYVNNGATPPVFTRTFLGNGNDSRITGTTRASNAICLGDLDRDGDLDALTAEWTQSQPSIFANLHRQIDAPRTVQINTVLNIDHYSQPQYGVGIEWYTTFIGAPLIPRTPLLSMGDLGIDLSLVLYYPMNLALRGTGATKSTISQLVPNDVTLIGLPVWYQSAFWGAQPNLTAESRLSNVTRTLIQ